VDKRQTILFLTHIYPRYDKDYIAPFVGILAEHLVPYYNIVVVCPRHPRATSERNGVSFEYFKYSIKRWEKLSYTGNLFARVRGIRPHYQLLTICFLVCYLVKALSVIRRRRPVLIHSHWFVPSGLVGHVASILTGLPHVVTVYSDSFLIAKHKLLRYLAKTIFGRAAAVVAISRSVKEYVAAICANPRIIYPCSRVF